VGLLSKREEREGGGEKKVGLPKGVGHQKLFEGGKEEDTFLRGCTYDYIGMEGKGKGKGRNTEFARKERGSGKAGKKREALK